MSIETLNVNLNDILNGKSHEEGYYFVSFNCLCLSTTSIVKIKFLQVSLCVVAKNMGQERKLEMPIFHLNCLQINPMGNLPTQNIAQAMKYQHTIQVLTWMNKNIHKMNFFYGLTPLQNTPANRAPRFFLQTKVYREDVFY